MDLKSVIKAATGSESPWKSMTVLGAVLTFLLYGAPEALAFVGLDVHEWMKPLGPILMGLGIRRRL